jgi:hypothetical protein
VGGAEEDFPVLAAQHAVQRQLEAIRAALELADSGLGHLAVGFVRPACDEFLWLKYFAQVSAEDLRKIFLLMAVRDGLRSVAAAQGYVGAESMIAIGFPRSLLDSVPATLDTLRLRLGECDIANLMGDAA